MLFTSNTGLLVEKRQILFNVKNYISLKRGVYRPYSTYKTAKMIYQKSSHKAEVDSCSVEGKKNSMAYIPAFDRRLHIAICNHLIERSN